MNRDVTKTLAVDATDLSCSTIDGAFTAIKRGHRAVVADDATAPTVLERLGLYRSDAIDQVRASHGPLRNPSDECLRDLRALVPTVWLRDDP